LKAARCGLALAEQVVETVPTVDHDQPIDLLVTDEEIVHFGQST
jgi:5-formyltetrahydrofolate cyclo-ligase